MIFSYLSKLFCMWLSELYWRDLSIGIGLYRLTHSCPPTNSQLSIVILGLWCSESRSTHKDIWLFNVVLQSLENVLPTDKCTTIQLYTPWWHSCYYNVSLISACLLSHYFGLFQLIPSHRILLNQLKSSVFFQAKSIPGMWFLVLVLNTVWIVQSLMQWRWIISH